MHGSSWKDETSPDVLLSKGTNNASAVTPMPESTFWNWHGGTQSFASFGCSCQPNPDSRQVPPGASNQKGVPLCFDVEHWTNK
eukprot:12433660-Ditylum_brightwellii.AAC.1